MDDEKDSIDGHILERMSSDVKIFGSSEGKGTINPDRGDKAKIYFKGDGAGTYTCRIFTLTGEFVNMVEHNNPYDDSEAWDLTTINRQEVAPGLYVFAVELSDGRKHIGKFAIIR